MPSRKVVLLFFKLCEEIWRGSPATQTMVGSSRLVMLQLRLWSHHRPCRRWIDICIWWWRPPRLWWIGATGLMLSWQATEERDWIDSLLWSITQEYLNIKRHLLRQLEATYEEFKQTLNRWSSTMDNLNSNTEVVVQHIVSSGPSYHMPPPSPHPSSNDSSQCELCTIWVVWWHYTDNSVDKLSQNDLIQNFLSNSFEWCCQITERTDSCHNIKIKNGI